MAQTTADTLVDIPVESGVEMVFGLPGDGINGVMEALRTRRDDIRFIQRDDRPDVPKARAAQNSANSSGVQARGANRASRRASRSVEMTVMTRSIWIDAGASRRTRGMDTIRAAVDDLHGNADTRTNRSAYRSRRWGREWLIGRVIRRAHPISDQCG